MDKASFIELLKNPDNIQNTEAELLEEITQKYPYFSLTHLLIAKYQYKQQSMLAPQKIRKAALYAYNRSVLKKLLMGVPTIEQAVQEIQKPTIENKIKEASQEAKSFFQNLKQEMDDFDKKISEASQEELDKELSSITNSYTPKNYFDENTIDEQISETDKTEVQKEQNTLIDTFLNFEMPKNISNVSENLFDEVLKEESTSSQTPVPHQLEYEAMELFESGKLEDSLALYEKMSLENPQNAAFYSEQKKSIQKKIQESQPKVVKTIEQIFNTFNNSKQEKTIEKPIEKQTEPVKTPTPTVEPIVNSNLNTDVTEADAMALFGEGKIKEAVEIYRKLILQFPEKKSYFTSQIEILES